MESLSRTAQGRPSSELASHTETRQGAHGLSEDSIRKHPSLALPVAICNFRQHTIITSVQCHSDFQVRMFLQWKFSRQESRAATRAMQWINILLAEYALR